MGSKKLFDKYIRTEEEGKAHATLSASGAERWMGCPASVSLSEGRPNPPNVHSIKGTNAHTLLQFVLENPGNTHSVKAPSAKKFREHIGYSPEMMRAVLVAAKFIWNEQDKNPKLQTFIEQKVKLPGVGFGTADVILYHPFGLLHVIDFKYGTYPVQAIENLQGLYYAVASAEDFGWDFSQVWITIIQPNSTHKTGPIRTWKTTPRRLERAEKDFIRGAERTRLSHPDVVPNHKYCWFCPARQVCPAQIAEREKGYFNNE